jgi:hypothetical protein
MTDLRDEPPRTLEDPKEILLQQLSYHRATLLAKLVGRVCPINGVSGGFMIS